MKRKLRIIEANHLDAEVDPGSLADAPDDDEEWTLTPEAEQVWARFGFVDLHAIIAYLLKV